MNADHLDDDENVKAMRDTAKRIGLTQLLLYARDGGLDAHDVVRECLKMLGERSEYQEKG